MQNDASMHREGLKGISESNYNMYNNNYDQWIIHLSTWSVNGRSSAVVDKYYSKTTMQYNF